MEMEITISLILLFLGIACLVVIHTCIVRIALRSGYENGENNGIRGSPNMTQDEIKKLPSFKYRVEEKERSCVECAVCLEGFKDGDLCRLLPNCKHSFHTQCIDLWLKKTAVCPICRDDVSKKKEVERKQSSDEVGVELV